MTVILRVFIFVLLIYAIYKISLTFSKRSKLWTIKRLWIFLSIYIGIGIVSILILSMTTNSPQLLKQEQLREILKEEEEVWSLLHENKIDNIPPTLVVHESSYNLPTDELVVTRKNREDWMVNIYVSKREDPQSNEIYAKVIQTPYAIDGIDITDQIVPRMFEFENSELLVGEQEKVELVYNQMNPTLYMIEDFRGLDLNNDDLYHYVTGTEILYLSVPEHINIMDEDELVFPINF